MNFKQGPRTPINGNQERNALLEKVTYNEKTATTEQGTRYIPDFMT